MYPLKFAGWLLLAGAIGVTVPYIILTVVFDYPDILRENTGTILTSFQSGGTPLIFTWFAFGVLGLPLLIAYIIIGQQLENRLSSIRWATTIGVLSVIAQMIGLLRWVFVVPALSRSYVASANPTEMIAISTSFQTIHQFAGVLLGEHIGQLFTIVYTIVMSSAFVKLKLIPGWLGISGLVLSVIYLAAQLELFATVIPGFPVWPAAGFFGSTLWLLWLVIVAVYLIRNK